MPRPGRGVRRRGEPEEMTSGGVGPTRSARLGEVPPDAAEPSTARKRPWALVRQVVQLRSPDPSVVQCRADQSGACACRLQGEQLIDCRDAAADAQLDTGMRRTKPQEQFAATNSPTSSDTGQIEQQQAARLPGRESAARVLPCQSQPSPRPRANVALLQTCPGSRRPGRDRFDQESPERRPDRQPSPGRPRWWCDRGRQGRPDHARLSVPRRSRAARPER